MVVALPKMLCASAGDQCIVVLNFLFGMFCGEFQTCEKQLRLAACACHPINIISK